MPSPMDMLLAQVDWKCVTCGVSMKVGCDCQAKRDADRVMLRCPKCMTEKRVDRDDSDPPGTAVVEVRCPDCNGGDFDCPTYFDAAGGELQWNE